MEDDLEYKVLACIHQNKPCSENTLQGQLHPISYLAINRVCNELSAKGSIVKTCNAPAKYELKDALPYLLKRFFTENKGASGTTAEIRVQIQKVFRWPCSLVQIQSALDKMQRNGQVTVQGQVYMKHQTAVATATATASAQAKNDARKGELKDKTVALFQGDHRLCASLDDILAKLSENDSIDKTLDEKQRRLFMAEILDELVDENTIHVVRARDYGGNAQASPPQLYRLTLSEEELKEFREERERQRFNLFYDLQDWVTEYIALNANEVICMTHLFEAHRATGKKQGRSLRQAIDALFSSGDLVLDERVSFRFPKKSGGSRFEHRILVRVLEEPELESVDEGHEDTQEEQDDEPIGQ
jgi:hypothetical protein